MFRLYYYKIIRYFIIFAKEKSYNQIVMSAYFHKQIPSFRLMLVLLFLTCTLTGFWQQQGGKDFRSELDLFGTFPAFALAPDGNCWLLSGNNGHAYYTEDIQSDWHCATPLYPADKQTWTEINDFSFFDSTTSFAITNDNWGQQSYCYLTEDQGKSWSLLPIDKKNTYFYTDGKWQENRQSAVMEWFMDNPTRERGVFHLLTKNSVATFSDNSNGFLSWSGDKQSYGYHRQERSDAFLSLLRIFVCSLPSLCLQNRQRLPCATECCMCGR